MAQSQARDITIPQAPRTAFRDVFKAEYKAQDGDKKIAALARTSRQYGIGSFAVVIDGQDPASPLVFEDLWKQSIAINVLDRSTRRARSPCSIRTRTARRSR